MEWITQNIDTFGYAAVVILMALESANIPIPSEIVLPFAGFLVFRERFNFHMMAFMGGLGCAIGSAFSYFLGKYLGRTLLEKYGKWFFIGPKQVALGDRWMTRYGNFTSFFSRLLPVVRTFISFIAGVWRVPFAMFLFLSFVGSLIWSYFLVYVGYRLGENWVTLRPLWEKFDIAIGVVILIAITAYIYHHWKSSAKA